MWIEGNKKFAAGLGHDILSTLSGTTFAGPLALRKVRYSKSRLIPTVNRYTTIGCLGSCAGTSKRKDRQPKAKAMAHIKLQLSKAEQGPEVA